MSAALVCGAYELALPQPPQGWPLGYLEPPRSQGRRRVPHYVSGECRVSLPRLGKALGRGAWALWQALCNLRDTEGHVRATQVGLGRIIRQKPRYVEKALRRLEQAGLVAPVGWVWEWVPKGKSKARLEVYRRLVRGAWYGMNENRGGMALVPSKCAEWLTAGPARWGGKRPGAGRKKRNQEGALLGGRTVIKRGHRSGSLKSLLNQNLKKDEAAAPMRPALPSFSFSQKEILATMPPADPAHITPDAVPPHPELPKHRGAPLRVGGDLEPGVPRQPSNGYTIIPPPPRLEPTMTPEEKVFLLGTAYRGAVSYRTKKPCWAYKGRDPRKWKDFVLLLKAAELLEAKDIPPVHWATWSIDLWQKHGCEGTAPPPKWCFSEKRIAERAGWCRSEYNSYGWTGNTVIPPIGDLLARRWQGMMNDFAYALPDVADPYEALRQIVAAWWPGDLYERMVAATNAAQKDYLERLKRQIKEGVWVWPE